MKYEEKFLKEKYRSFREEYRPREIGILFVAESPPKPKNKEIPYFYNKHSSQRARKLWWYFNKVLYDGEMGEKEGFLERFRDDGYFLIDVFSTRRGLIEVKEDGDYEKVAEISQRFFERILKLEPEKVVFLGKRCAKLIAGCLPFGNRANVEKFKKFVEASTKKEC